MFAAVRADTPGLLLEAYRLRYQVFCIENHIFDPDKNPNEMERDEFDHHSVQALLQHRDTGLTVGSVRLILPRLGSSVGSLPIHRVCQDAQVHNRDLLPVDTTFELSRFAICKQSRRRIATARPSYRGTDLLYESDSTRVIPHICVGLMTIALKMGIEHGIETVCAVMEPSLLRLVAKMGFQFHMLGPAVWYYGWRQPVYARVGPMLRTVRQQRPEIWGMVTDRGRLWPARLETQADVEETALSVSLS